MIFHWMASQITSFASVYSIVYSGADQRKHQSSASPAFLGVNSRHKRPVTHKMFPLDDVIMYHMDPVVLCRGKPIFSIFTFAFYESNVSKTWISLCFTIYASAHERLSHRWVRTPSSLQICTRHKLRIKLGQLIHTPKVIWTILTTHYRYIHA